MPETVYKITLRCWRCGKTQEVCVSQPPQFAFELAKIAGDSGWVGVIDIFNSRSLVFCSKDCDNLAKKKNGQYRLRPKVNKNAEVSTA